MFELRENEYKRLMSMGLIDFLQEIHNRIERIYHRPNTDFAYQECIALSGYIRQRIVTELRISWEEYDLIFVNNLRQSEMILDLYVHSESDIRKSARIAEFIREYKFDLAEFIKFLGRDRDNPETTVG